jgi:hypothetical protein
MQQSPPWVANSQSTPQEIPCILWNRNVRYRIHKGPLLVHILSQMHPIHNLPIYFPKIHTYLLHGAEYYLKSWLTPTLSKKSCFLYGTRRLITVFTKARHWTVSWASWIQFAPSIPIPLRSILMLSSPLCLGLPSGFLPSGLPTKTL